MVTPSRSLGKSCPEAVTQYEVTKLQTLRQTSILSKIKTGPITKILNRGCVRLKYEPPLRPKTLSKVRCGCVCGWFHLV